jgi:lipopolysaccharide export system permease protein
VILGRYILREFFGNWLAVVLSVSVLVLGSQLTRALERAAEANLPSDIVLKLTLLTFLQTAQITAPLAMLLAVVLTYGRLAHDGEMSAIRSSGISAWRSSRGILTFGALAAVALGAVTLYFAPQLALREQQTLGDAYRRSQLAAFQPGRFTQLPGTGLVIHVGAAGADGLLRDVLFLRRDGRTLEVIRAQSASYRLDAEARNLQLQLRSGERLIGTAGEAASQRVRFGTFELSLPLPNVQRMRTSRDMLPTADLFGSPRLDDQAELQWRVSVPVMCLMLTVLAVPLSQLRPRQGRYTRMAPALVLFFFYVNLLIAMRSNVARGAFPLFPGLWVVHAAIGGIALAWLTRRRWWSRRSGA